MFRQNQYWLIVTKSRDNFEKAVQNSDIPIDSNVLLCVRQELVPPQNSDENHKYFYIISIHYGTNSLF